MSAKKTYTVMKDGDVLKELKTLAAAKKMADLEDAEVFCGGLCVYAPDPVVEEPDADATDIKEPDIGETDAPDLDEPVDAELYVPNKCIAAPVIETVTPDRYRLKHLMNVRKAPSMYAEKLKTLKEGAVVAVLTIEDDWLHLDDDTYILYGGGKFAEKTS